MAAVALTAAALCFTPQPAEACTAAAFTSKAKGAQELVIAKNYDWANDLGVVMANKRGVAKTAMQLMPGASTPARWTSRYASVTFNQYGREMPNGGMNEKGLVVEVLWLTGSRYPASDKRAMLNELQWVQYQLDNFATLPEVVAAAPLLRVANIYASVHYFVCDTEARCGSFEYLDGKLVIHQGDGMPQRALANSTYARSTRFASQVKGLGGAAKAPKGSGSLARFARLALAAKGSPSGGSLVDTALGSLDDVGQGNFTKWQIAYEPKRLKLHFRTHRHRALKTIDVGKLVVGAAGACSADVRQLDLATNQAGDANGRFTRWTQRSHRALVEASFAKLGASARYLKGFVGKLVDYPASTACAIQKK